MSAHEIYEYFATGRGTGKLDDAQAATRAEWEAEDERAHMIRKQGELIRGGWSGTASDAAFGAAQPLAESADHGATMLSRAEDLLDRQSGSYHRAATDVTPVPEEPPSMDITDPMVPFSDYEAEVTSYQADAHHNMDVYRGYDGASQYNETNMPGEYSTVNHAGGNISVTSDSGRSADPGDSIEVPEHAEPGPGSESGPYRGVSWPGGAPAGGPPVSGPVTNPSLPQQTTPSDYSPPAINTPGGLPPTTFQPSPGPGQPGFVPGLPVGGVTGGSPGGPGGPGGPGARGGGPYGPGARGGMPGGGAGGGAGGGGAGGNSGSGGGARGGVPGPGASVG
ncbi:MAG: hypothetical protein WBA97_31835, partial [Actinophytocola sp.]|uniref:hypothetical protein n=1 Tax=Actinophytocola sp. TaxID=1872138 RepID=UPI003C72E870